MNSKEVIKILKKNGFEFKSQNGSHKKFIVEVLPERLVEFNGNRSAYLQNLVLQDLKEHHINL